MAEISFSNGSTASAVSGSFDLYYSNIQATTVDLMAVGKVDFYLIAPYMWTEIKEMMDKVSAIKKSVATHGHKLTPQQLSKSLESF